MRNTDPTSSDPLQLLRIRPAPRPHRHGYFYASDLNEAYVLIDRLWTKYPAINCWAVVAITGRTLRLVTRPGTTPPSKDQGRLF